ncbi:MAG: hypothetical protein COW32_00160 [Candidatus Aquicultor secundus]
MGNLTKKVKKKKSRKTKAKIASLVTISLAMGFLNTAAAFYLRQVYNAKTLLPPTGISRRDVIFNVGDITILDKAVALKILVDSDLLIAEEIRQVAIVALLVAFVYLLGKDMLDRVGLFIFIGGLSSLLYYVFLFAFTRWPSSLLSKDIIAVVPNPIIVPTYIPLVLSVVSVVGGSLLVFKRK